MSDDPAERAWREDMMSGVAELKGELRELRGELRAAVNSDLRHEKQRDDHESRIRGLESAKSTAWGIAVIVPVLIALASFVMNLLAFGRRA